LQGDGVVRDIIGSNGATDSHVDARLISTIILAVRQQLNVLKRVRIYFFILWMETAVFIHNHQ